MSQFYLISLKDLSADEFISKWGPMGHWNMQWRVVIFLAGQLGYRQYSLLWLFKRKKQRFSLIKTLSGLSYQIQWLNLRPDPHCHISWRMHCKCSFGWYHLVDNFCMAMYDFTDCLCWLAWRLPLVGTYAVVSWSWVWHTVVRVYIYFFVFLNNFWNICWGVSVTTSLNYECQIITSRLFLKVRQELCCQSLHPLLSL